MTGAEYAAAAAEIERAIASLDPPTPPDPQRIRVDERERVAREAETAERIRGMLADRARPVVDRWAGTVTVTHLGRDDEVHDLGEHVGIPIGRRPDGFLYDVLHGPGLRAAVEAEKARAHEQERKGRRARALWRDIARRRVRSSSRLRVLDAVASFADADGRNAYPSRGAIAEAVGLGVGAISKHLRLAEAEGWIRRVRRYRRANRRPSSSLYVFDIPEEGDGDR